MSGSILFLTVLLLAGAIPAGMASGRDLPFGGGELELEDFVTYGRERGSAQLAGGDRYAEGSVWEIHGRHAAVRDDLARLSRLRILIEDRNGRKTTITSPGCEYNRLSQEIKSDATVCLAGQGLRITGIGYDLYLQEKERILVIRNTVHIVLRQSQIARQKKETTPRHE